MLLGLQREPWWPVPAETALVRARAPPGFARLEVLGSFPTLFGSKDPAKVLDPVVEGARAARPAPLVGVVWIAKKVVIAVRLFRQLSDVAMVAVDRPETPGAIGIEVELALSSGDELRDRFPHPAGGAEPVQRQPGGHEQPTNTRYRSQQRIRVGGHRIGMADKLDDPCLAHEGESPCRSLEQGLEAAQVRRDGGAGVLPGNTVDPSRVGIELVAAQHHATRFGLPVDEVVRVAKARHVARELGARDRA